MNDKILTRALMNMAAHIGGIVLLSQAYGWKIGVGAGLLVWFLKDGERA